MFYIYKKIVLSKVEINFERKCEYLWDFFNCTSGQVDHWTHLPKSWFLKILLAPGKRATAGVEPCTVKDFFYSLVNNIYWVTVILLKVLFSLFFYLLIIIVLIFKDVLILNQFIAPNGRVYPKHVTGNCYTAQWKLENLLYQSYSAGMEVLNSV